MTELVQENLSRAQKQQKVWYDKMLGAEDISWYWYSTNKLIAQWQGPYMVVWHLGKVNYEVEMKDKWKRKIMHVNMLRKWRVPLDLAYLSLGMEEDSEELEGSGGSEELCGLDGDPSGEVEERPVIGENLDDEQRVQCAQ